MSATMYVSPNVAAMKMAVNASSPYAIHLQQRRGQGSNGVNGAPSTFPSGQAPTRIFGCALICHGIQGFVGAGRPLEMLESVLGADDILNESHQLLRLDHAVLHANAAAQLRRLPAAVAELVAAQGFGTLRLLKGPVCSKGDQNYCS